MVCELSDFPPGPVGDQIPLCEIDGDLHYSSPEFLNLHVYTTSVCNLLHKFSGNYINKVYYLKYKFFFKVSNHPNVIISRDVLQPSLRKSYEGKVFLPSSDSLLQRLQDAW